MEDKKVLTEVYEILKHLSSENYNKIPSNVIDLIKENKDEHYIWKYDITKSLEEQNISRGTVAALSYINIEYLLNDRQREFIENIHRQNEENLEQLKREEYNSDSLFKNRKNNVNTTNEDISLIEYQNVKWYKKIIIKLFSIFKRNNK